MQALIAGISHVFRTTFQSGFRTQNVASKSSPDSQPFPYQAATPRMNTANISSHIRYMIQDIELSYILILTVYIKRFLIVIDVIIIYY